MLVVVAYDIKTSDSTGARRLQKVAKECLNYGQRVQNSVFECVLDTSQYLILKKHLVALIDPEVDSLRFYKLGNNYKNKVDHIGCKEVFDVEAPLIF